MFDKKHKKRLRGLMVIVGVFIIISMILLYMPGLV